MPAYRTRDARPALAISTSDASALEAPSVEIIAPTPRAFTFPINTGPFPAQSTFSSPSASPFEPERGPATPSCHTPPLVRTYTPSAESELSSPTGSLYSPVAAWSRPKSHRAAPSVASTEPEARRPKKGDDDYIKRPENAFILFRRKCVEERLQEQEAAASTSGKDKVKKQRQADLSKMISQQWKALPAEDRAYWEDLAKEKKKEHEALYPNYVYRPQRLKKGDKAKLAAAAAAAKKGKGSARTESEHESATDLDEGISFTLPISHPSSARHGRTMSAPTPPISFQTIQIPTMYIPDGPSHSHNLSLPGSPSLSSIPVRRTPVDRTPRPMQAEQHALMAPFGSDFSFPEHDAHYPGVYELRPHYLPQLDMSMPSYAPMPILSSPCESDGPYTPASAMSCGDFSFEIPMPPLVCPTWSWEGPALWPGTDGDLLHDGHFDLGSIPPVEVHALLPKYDEPEHPAQRQPAQASSMSDCGPQTHSGPWLSHDSRADPFAGISFDDMML